MQMAFRQRDAEEALAAAEKAEAALEAALVEEARREGAFFSRGWSDASFWIDKANIVLGSFSAVSKPIFRSTSSLCNITLMIWCTCHRCHSFGIHIPTKF